MILLPVNVFSALFRVAKKFITLQQRLGAHHTSIQQRYNAKLREMEARVHAQDPKRRSQEEVQTVESVDPLEGVLRTKASSWVRGYAYDNNRQIMYMTTHTGKTYAFNNIDVLTAQKIRRAAAECHTTDPTGSRRWWQTKEPSLGAAYWQYLSSVPRRSISEVNAAEARKRARKQKRMQRNRPKARYMGGMKSRRAKAPKRGRPTKFEDKRRRFGWTKQFESQFTITG